MKSYKTPRKKRRSEKPNSMGKTNFFLSILPFSPWEISATWLHVGTPKKIQEK
jgi:hypothetical protein